MHYHSHSPVQTGTWTYLRAQAYDRAHDAHDAAGGSRGKFSIAISRETGVDARAIAHAIGQRLGWRVWDQELVSAVAERLHSPAEDLEPIDERHIGWLEETLEMLLSLHTVTQFAYVHELVRTMMELGERGEAVIVGRGSAHVLPAETTLRVRLVAPLAVRALAASRELGLKRAEDALPYLEKIDRNRTRFVIDHFQKDPSDPANYDLILNTARMTVDDCAEVVVDALRVERASRAARAAAYAPAPAALH